MIFSPGIRGHHLRRNLRLPPFVPLLFLFLFVVSALPPSTEHFQNTKGVYFHHTEYFDVSCSQSSPVVVLRNARIAPKVTTNIVRAGGVTSQISIIARPDDWKSALREIADADQLSPEYGGTGSSQAELPSLSDALYAAGGSGGSDYVSHVGSGFTAGGQDDAESCVARVHARSPPRVPVRDRGGEGEEGAVKVGAVEIEASRRAQFRFVEAGEGEEKEESDGGGRRGWFGSAWGALGGWWVGGDGGSVDGSGSGVKRDREVSGATLDEEVRCVLSYGCFLSKVVILVWCDEHVL